MTRPSIEIEGSSIVLIGDFNPAIFQPAWFASKELVRPEEAETALAAPGAVVARRLSSFRAGWVDIQVTEDRFTAQTSDPAQYAPLRDLVLGVFRILDETPLRQMGFNTNKHFRMPSREDWDDFGDFLVPKPPWSGLFGEPGLQSVRIGVREPAEGQSLPVPRQSVKIEPSLRIRPGVYVETNEHYEYGGDHIRARLLSDLEDSWQAGLERARTLIDTLFDRFYATR